MTDKLKPMEYHAEHKREVLGEGVHDGYLWAIISLGTHPCAYVEIPEEHPWFEKKYQRLRHVRCNGGLTYSDYGPVGSSNERNAWWIGWDYAHPNDYAPREEIIGEQRGKQWTTEEIFAEVKEVIRQAKEVEENDND